MEYRVAVTMTEYGRPDVAEQNVERVFRGFNRAHPGVEAIPSTDGSEGTLEVSFSVEAATATEAFERGNSIFADGMEAADLDPDITTVVRVEVTLIPVEQTTEERELLPA
jgi:hypothetical protein